MKRHLTVMLISNSGDFRQEDVYADLDAIYITDKLLSKDLIGTQISTYYSSGLSNNRFTYFIDGRTKEQFKADVRPYTRLKYINIQIWPLYVGELTQITDVQGQACTDAFTDYIFPQQLVGG